MNKRRAEAPEEARNQKQKKLKSDNASISNVELMAMLRTASTPMSSKLDQAFRYVGSRKRGSGSTRPGIGAVPMPHFISFLADWMQSGIIACAKSQEAAENASTDVRSWIILHWCLSSSQTNLNISPGILKGLELVLKESSSEELLETVGDFLELLFKAYDRSFRPQLLDWTSLVSSSLEVVGRDFLRSEQLSRRESLFLKTSTLVAEGFAKFLTTFGSPKVAFQATVEKLLNSALVILGEICTVHEVVRLQAAVSNVLENGLFQTIQPEGFPEVCAAAVRWIDGGELQAREEPDAAFASVHKLLFEKLKQLLQDKRFSALSSLGSLLRLFIRRFKAHWAAVNEDVFGVRGSAQDHDLEIVEKQQAASADGEAKKVRLTKNQQQFLVFVELALPLIQELRKQCENRNSSGGFKEEKALLAAVNGLFRVARDEHIYIPTRDTPSRGHFKFIKHYYSTLIDCAKSLSSSQENQNKDEFKEIISGITCVLDMDHRAADDHAQEFWLLLLSATVVLGSCDDSMAEVITVGCQMLEILSELRNFSSLPVLFSSLKPQPDLLFLSTSQYESAIRRFFSDPSFLKSLGRTMEILPEAQAPEIVNMVRQDASKTLMLVDDMAGEAVVLAAAEVYVHILENLNVTSTNAFQVGSQVRQFVGSVVAEPLRELLAKLVKGKLRKKKATKASAGLKSYFLLRLYMVCRTLHRQCASLMPPQKAKKANAAAHELDLDNLDPDWMQIEDTGIFSWIQTPRTTSVSAVVSKLRLEVAGGGFLFLHFVLDSLIVQRLNDLRRYIHFVEYFEAKFTAFCVEDPVMESVTKEAVEIQEPSNVLVSQLLASFKQEANDLVVLLLQGGDLYSVERMTKDLHTNEMVSKAAWNEVVGNLSEENIYSARWHLITRSTDLWSNFANRKGIKSFLNYALCTWDQAGLSVSSLTQELLSNLPLYENQVIQSFLIPSAWEALRKLLHLDVKFKKLKKLAQSNQWMDFVLTERSAPVDNPLLSSSNLDRSIGLVQLISSFSAGHESELSSTLYICCVCYVERFSLNILESTDAENCSKLFQLLAACRKALQLFSIQNEEASSAFDVRVCHWLYRSIDIASQCLGKEYIDKVFVASVVKSTQCILQLKTKALFSRESRNFLVKRSSDDNAGSTKSDENLVTFLEMFTQQARDMVNFSLEWGEAEQAYKLLGSASSTRSLLWTVTGCVEVLDKNCHEDKELRWSPFFSTGWISCLQEVEQAVVTLLLGRLAEVQDSVAAKDSIADFLLASKPGDEPSFLEDEENDEEEQTAEQDGEDGSEDDGGGSDAESLHDDDEDGAADQETEAPDEQQETTEMRYLKPLKESQQTALNRLFNKNLNREQSEAVGELFMTMSALVRLRSLCFSPYALKRLKPETPSTVTAFLVVLHALLTKATITIYESASANTAIKQANLFWLFGAVKCMESIGFLLPSLRPLVPAAEYLKLVTMHIDLLAAITCFQSSTEVNENVPGLKELKVDSAGFYSDLRVAVADSFGALIKYAPRHHLLVALRTIQKCLAGGSEVSKFGSPLRFGDCDNGRVGVVIAAGVGCLYVTLDAVSGPWRLKTLGKFSPILVAGLQNLISHLQGPSLFFDVNTQSEENKISSVPVLLQCLEVINRLASRPVLFPMKASHVALALDNPAGILRSLYQSRLPSFIGHSNPDRVEDKAVLNLYITSCKLVCSVLRHRNRESGRSIALLGESVRVMLYCLESSGDKIQSRTSSIKSTTALQCAQWLRRVYEELGEHKETLSRYCTHALSDYLSVLSGTGPFAAGLDRDVDKELRPGVYALLCSPMDLQQLHAALGDGPLRNNLAMLRQDYDRNYKYTGKV